LKMKASGLSASFLRLRNPRSRSLSFLTTK
jgi:hypothetical protein